MGDLIRAKRKIKSNTKKLMNFFLLWINWGLIGSDVKEINEMVWFQMTLELDQRKIVKSTPSFGHAKNSNFQCSLNFYFKLTVPILANSNNIELSCIRRYYTIIIKRFIINAHSPSLNEWTNKKRQWKKNFKICENNN